MPRQNFDGVQSSHPGDTVPDGVYPATLMGVEPGQTKGGEPKWDIYLEIVDGTEKGKIIRDQWLWYGKGLGRTKACISGCGVEVVKGDHDYRPEHFVNRPVYIQVATKSRDVGDKTFTECRPTFNGYSPDEERPYVPVPVKPQQANLPAGIDDPFGTSTSEEAPPF